MWKMYLKNETTTKVFKPIWMDKDMWVTCMKYRTVWSIMVKSRHGSELCQHACDLNWLIDTILWHCKDILRKKKECTSLLMRFTLKMQLLVTQFYSAHAGQNVWWAHPGSCWIHFIQLRSQPPLSWLGLVKFFLSVTIIGHCCKSVFADC